MYLQCRHDTLSLPKFCRNRTNSPEFVKEFVRTSDFFRRIRPNLPDFTWIRPKELEFVVQKKQKNSACPENQNKLVFPLIVGSQTEFSRISFLCRMAIFFRIPSKREIRENSVWDPTISGKNNLFWFSGQAEFFFFFLYHEF